MYEISFLLPLNCRTYVNCCHAENLWCFPLFLCVRWSLEAWFWGFMSKYEFCISGLMNARLSVHCSLKRAKRRNYRLCTLTSSLKRAAPAQHVLKYSYGPEWNLMLFFATIVTLTKTQCQETNAHYILKYYKWNAWVTLTYFSGTSYVKFQDSQISWSDNYPSNLCFARLAC